MKVEKTQLVEGTTKRHGNKRWKESGGDGGGQGSVVGNKLQSSTTSQISTDTYYLHTKIFWSLKQSFKKPHRVLNSLILRISYLVIKLPKCFQFFHSYRIWWFPTRPSVTTERHIYLKLEKLGLDTWVAQNESVSYQIYFQGLIPFYT